MPVKRCQRDGKQGWKWGDQGTCYIGPGARQKAEKQGQAIKANEERSMGKELKKVELFAVGVWNGMEFTLPDLNGIAAAFHQLGDNHRVPLKFGHNDEQPLTDGLPALGKVTNVWVAGDKLLGSFTNVPDIVYDAVTNGLYDKVSIELDMGVEYKDSYFPWVLSGVALLGADIPAVNTLSDLSAFMTRGEDFNVKQHVQFSRNVIKQEDDDMSEELKAKIAALEAQNAELQKKSMTFSTENERLKKEAEDREVEQKKAEFKRGKDQLTADLDVMVKAKQIDPAKREKLLADIGDSTEALARAVYTVAVMKEELPNKAGLPEGRQGSGASGDEGKAPDVVVSERSFKVARENKISFAAAQHQVLREDPELARQYIDMNGVKTAGGE